MNDDQFDDLKQFIESTVSQTEVHLTQRIDEVDTKLTQRIDEVDVKLTQRIDILEHKMGDGFSGVADAIEGLNSRNDATDSAITKLKHKLA